MKANAPDKIYACFGVFGLIQATEIKTTSKDIEYTQTDAFIEKAEEYLYKQLNEGNMECGDIETFIEDFKNYMKGE